MGLVNRVTYVLSRISYNSMMIFKKQIIFSHELLFRHVFEIQIHNQTQIRKTFILALATNGFL